MKYPNRIIQEGEENKRLVKAIQMRLNELGCGPLEGTGVFGPKTKAAVKLFQSTHSDKLGNPLEIDGKLGAISWEILFGPDNIQDESQAPNSLLAETLQVARSQIGIMEKPPGSNRGPEVEQYLGSVDLGPGLFWCAAFVYWCFDEAAKDLQRKNPLVKTAGCLDHWNRSGARKILSADAINQPSVVKPGCIFIISHGSGMGHTGIVEKISGGYIQTIEGNSNPAGSSNGIGVFRLQRKIAMINKGFLLYK